jgi:hypothetical protein
MIIHFWELPERRNYILLKEKFKIKVMKKIRADNYPWKFRSRVERNKISILKIKKIAEEQKIPLEEFEKNMCWIGGNNSKGISNPNFPINLKTKNAVRFIAAIVNDGTLTKESEGSKGRLMYDNYDKSLRDSIMKDYLQTFGGKPNEVAFRCTEKKKYFEFCSVARDIMEIILQAKGPKCETNLSIPRFILEDNSLASAWIEQTIADEGEVKYFPQRFRRAIVWRRSIDVTEVYDWKISKDTSIRKLPKNLQEIIEKQRCELISQEEILLDNLGITYRLYNIGIYLTSKNKIRARWQIGITKRENLLKLRKLIKIPAKEKEDKFTLMTQGFKRFKEPLKIKKAIISLGKKKNEFTSIDLKIKMNYKKLNCANKWINHFQKEGLIKKVQDSYYGGKSPRNPAKYSLILHK